MRSPLLNCFCLPVSSLTTQDCFQHFFDCLMCIFPSQRRMWNRREEKDMIWPHENNLNHDHQLHVVSEIQCDPKPVSKDMKCKRSPYLSALAFKTFFLTFFNL
ncbi:hypothetical protein O6H91_10G010400 [Diphasiastrum complanatum]|uniref:Uncharacterized protein n=1 Tax=Diphasiastrum complanatum TaxID=34168 RepID=A0ACC2CEC8_DIPCM|nr:hypothetical protein O6H91_10G010400 [Diphasiastrum complanatum]